MTMPVYPFVNPHGASYTSGQVPTHTELNLAFEQGAAAADGRVWTDLAVVKNWKQSGAAAIGLDTPKVACRDPVSRRWIVAGDEASAASWIWTISGEQWLGPTAFPGSLTTINDIHANSAGVIVAVGTIASSAAKLRRSIDGGANWTTESFGAADSGEAFTIKFVESLGLWLVAKKTTGTGTWSSPDAITWTNRAGTAGAFIVREAPTRILTIGGVGGTGYQYSDDGTTWTQQTFPVTLDAATPVRRGFWSDHYGKFFVVTDAGNGIYSSATGLTGSWTLVHTFDGSGLGCIGRVILRGDGNASIDGGVTWVPVLERLAPELQFFATPFGVLGIDISSDTIYMSRQVGF